MCALIHAKTSLFFPSKKKIKSINQSIKQSVKQSSNQSISQSINGEFDQQPKE